MKLWLESEIVKINKAIIHRMEGYPTLDQVKTLKFLARHFIQEKTKAWWMVEVCL
jgi:hypothetical protein